MFWPEESLPQVQGSEVEWLDFTIPSLVIIQKPEIVQGHGKTRVFLRKVLCLLEGFQVCLFSFTVLSFFTILSPSIHPLLPAGFITSYSTQMEEQKKNSRQNPPCLVEASVVSRHCDLP
jgi:hypothetical protein